MKNPMLDRSHISWLSHCIGLCLCFNLCGLAARADMSTRTKNPFQVQIHMLEDQAVTGRVEVQGKRFFLTPTNGQKFEIQSTDFKTQTTLQNLQTGDVIRAITSPSQTPGVALVESIDFVGLNRLLGQWLTRAQISTVPPDSQDLTTAIVDFHDFSNMTILLPNSQTHFQYAISPKDALSWRFFFTDDSSVQLGELIIHDFSIEIHFFDSQTGKTQKTFLLEKIEPQQSKSEPQHVPPLIKGL